MNATDGELQLWPRLSRFLQHKANVDAPAKTNWKCYGQTCSNENASSSSYLLWLQSSLVVLFDVVDCGFKSAFALANTKRTRKDAKRANGIGDLLRVIKATIEPGC